MDCSQSEITQDVARSVGFADEEYCADATAVAVHDCFDMLHILDLTSRPSGNPFDSPESLSKMMRIVENGLQLRLSAILSKLYTGMQK